MLAKNFHYVDVHETQENLSDCETWEKIFEKIHVIIETKEVDTMFAFLTQKLAREASSGSSPLTDEQWTTLIDASLYADIEIDRISQMIPATDRLPCSTDARVTLFLLERYFALRTFGSADEVPFAILESALKVFAALQLTAPVQSAFDMYMRYCEKTFGAIPLAGAWHFLSLFVKHTSTDKTPRAHIQSVIQVILSCAAAITKKTNDQTANSTEECMEDMTFILETLAQWCTRFAEKVYVSPQDHFAHTMHETFAFTQWMLHEDIAQKALDAIHQPLERLDADSSDTPQESDSNASEPSRTATRKASRISSILRICACGRHNRTPELYHAHAEERSIAHYESFILYNLNSQLRPDLETSAAQSYRTAAVELVREATIAYCGKDLSAADEETFQRIQKIVICALCQPFVNKEISKNISKKDIPKEMFDLAEWKVDEENVDTAHQIFLVHPHYTYYPERIAMNALIKAMAELGHAAAFAVVDLTVMGIRKPVTYLENAPRRPTHKPLDQYTIEHLMRTCHVVNDVERARNMYWIMCEQQPGVQHRLTEKTKVYLSEMKIANFFPKHIFSADVETDPPWHTAEARDGG